MTIANNILAPPIFETLSRPCYSLNICRCIPQRQRQLDVNQASSSDSESETETDDGFGSYSSRSSSSEDSDVWIFPLTYIYDNKNRKIKTINSVKQKSNVEKEFYFVVEYYQKFVSYVWKAKIISDKNSWGNSAAKSRNVKATVRYISLFSLFWKFY